MNLSNLKITRSGTILLLLAVLVIYYVLYIFNGDTSSHKSQDEVDLKKLLIGSIQAAIEGGQKVAQIYNSNKLNIQNKGFTKEGANNPVTDADFQSHCVMYYGLKRTFPQIHIISEEHVEETKCLPLHTFDLDSTVLKNSYDVSTEFVSGNDITVWIDPLDATQEFTEKLVEYVTTMVCVAIKGVPTLGIIHFPFSGVTSWAWVGRHTPTKNSQTKVHGSVTVIASRSHKGNVSTMVKKALGNDITLMYAGGAGFKSLQVASGNVSAYVHTTVIKKWDICAGDAILRALGGSMTALNGDLIDYSAQADVINSGGLLASLKGHNYFLTKFADILPIR